MWRSGVSLYRHTSSLRLWEMKVGTCTFADHEIFLLYKETKGWHSYSVLFLLIFFDVQQMQPVRENKFHGSGGVSFLSQI